MRARLLLVLALLGAVTVAAFSVPLAASYAQSRTNEFVLARTADLQRFVALAGPATRGEDPGNLPGEVATYTALYDEPVLVVSTRGAPEVSSASRVDDPAVARALTSALRNQPVGLAGTLTPWGPDQVVFARATGTDAQITGAVALTASTQAARTEIGAVWLAVVVGGLVALGALLAVAVAVSSWVLRPLGRLSTGMGELVSVLPRAPTAGADDRLLPLSARSGPPELRELAQTFALMAGQVRRSTEAQRRLVADTAHQLRNPLAALQLRLDGLEDKVDPGAEENHRRAMAEADRLAELLDALLDLSRAEVPTGISGPERADCRPVLVAADRVEAWETSAARHGVVLHPPTGSVDHVVLFDGDDLGQVLDVLLDNACKYAGPGSEVQIAVEPAGGADHDAVRLSVIDTGSGVSREDLPRLRERFYRGTGVATRGSGLGLAIVEALVTAGRGELLLLASAGGGLTVRIDLPADHRAPPRRGPADGRALPDVVEVERG